MTLDFFRRNRRARTIEALYGAIVAQARAPVFYIRYGVPDTVNGRLDMVMLHLALMVGRLESGSSAARTAGQAIFDRFCQDMDDQLRERGVGDLAVPKEMRKLAEAFYGRSAAYREALSAASDEALVQALRRNIYAGQANVIPDAGVMALAAYMRAAARGLRALDDDAILNAAPVWPDAEGLQAAQN